MASSGNFCTLNPLAQPNAGTFSEGNLLFTHTASAWRTTAGTHGMTSGKWYWEAYQYEDLSGNGFPCGIYDIDSGKFVSNQASDYLGQSTSTYGAAYVCYTNTGSNAQKRHNGVESTISFAAGASGDVWQCAFDADAGKIWFGKNNTWDNSANPALGSNESYSSIPSSTWVPVTCSYDDDNSENYPQNFGQDDTFAGRITAQGNTDDNGHGVFKYSPPTGFLALCSANLPISDDIDPAQTDDDYTGGKFFNTVTYTGTGSSNAITGVGFQPDLVWIKKRNGSTEHKLTDSSRGVTKALQPDSINAESTDTNGLTAFGSDGFTVGSDSSYNNSSDTYVAWCWRLNGGTTASNTSGDINSTTQANDKTGLSVVLYTGNGSQGQTIGHGLTKAPEMVWFKNRDYGTRGVSMNWIASLSSATGSPFASLSGSSQSIKLSSNEKIQDFFRTQTNFTPTTSTFSVPSNGNAPYWFNGSGDDYVAYCWHSVENFSKFGIYKANANDDGPFIYTGFKPRMLFVKNLDENSTEWEVRDTAVNTGNPANKGIYWDQTQAEATRSEKYDILSNGFKIRTNGGPGNYNSGSNILYGAWADVPFKYNNTF